MGDVKTAQAVNTYLKVDKYQMFYKENELFIQKIIRSKQKE